MHSKNLLETKNWIEKNSGIDSYDFFRNFSNDLQNVVINKYPIISNILNSLNKKNAIFAAMTGSGSACFGIFDEKEIDLASNYFERNFPGWVVKKTKLNDF